MISHQMAAASNALLPLAYWGFLERANMLGARCDPHSIRFPKCEGIDGVRRTTNGRIGNDTHYPMTSGSPDTST